MENDQILLDRTLELFSRRGYDAVGVQEIVESAGLTKPTLYHYFGSKRGLLEALLKRESGHLLTSIVEAALYQGDLVLTLERVVRAYFSVAKQHSIFYRMQLGMYFSPPESETYQAVWPFAREQREIVEGVFIHAAEDHGNLRGRHTRYAVGLIGQINAVIGLYLNNEISLDDQRVYELVHQFMHGIYS